MSVVNMKSLPKFVREQSKLETSTDVFKCSSPPPPRVSLRGKEVTVS